jgi:hypothetical protein
MKKCDDMYVEKFENAPLVEYEKCAHIMASDDDMLDHDHYSYSQLRIFLVLHYLRIFHSSQIAHLLASRERFTPAPGPYWY